MVNFCKFRDKNRSHFRGDVPDDTLQLPLGVQNVVPLLGKIGIALIDPGVFLNSPKVRRTQGSNLPFQFGSPAVSGGDVLDLTSKFRGSAGGQLVGIPELIDDLPLLHGGGDLLLFQQCAGPLHVQNVLILFLCVPLGLGFRGLGGGAAFQHRLHLFIHGGAFRVVVGLPLFEFRNLPFQPGVVLPDGVHQGQFFLPVALHGSLKLLQVTNVGQGRRAFGLHGGFLGFQGRHTVGDGGVFVSRFGLAALQCAELLPCLGQLPVVDLNFRLLGAVALPVGAVSFIERFPLPAGGGFRLHDGVQENFVLFFQSFQPEHLILRFPELILRGGNLELHLIALAAGFP